MSTRSDNSRTNENLDMSYDSRMDFVRDPYNDFYQYRNCPPVQTDAGSFAKDFATGVIGAFVAMAIVSGMTALAIFQGANLQLAVPAVAQATQVILA